MNASFKGRGAIAGRAVGRLLLAVLAVLVVLAACVAINTWRHGSRQLEVAPVQPVAVDGAAAAAHLAEAVRARTVSSATDAQLNADQFRQLQAMLQARYPKAHAVMQREQVGDFALLYTWKGTDPSLPPIMLMAHQDVVPIAPGTEGDWTEPPFDGVIKDGMVWGRGAWDDKGNLISQMEAIELLAASGFQPRRTIHLAFGADEEVGGDRGAKQIAALLKSRGERLDFVIDEGLLITEGVLPDVAQQGEDGVGGFRVERGGGLVAQQDLGPVHQRAGDAHALLLPARQAPRSHVLLAFQSDQREQGIDALGDLRCRHAGHLQRQGHVLPHRLGREQVEVLEDHADAPAQRHQRTRAERADIDAIDEHAPAARPLQPVDGAQQARFAGAAAPDDAEDAACRDGEVDALQGVDIAGRRAVRLADALECDGAGRGRGHGGFGLPRVRGGGLGPGVCGGGDERGHGGHGVSVSARAGCRACRCWRTTCVPAAARQATPGRA